MITPLYTSKPVMQAGKVAGAAEHKEYVCAPEDIASLPGADVCLPGSIAWVVSEKKFYGFDGTDWQLLPSGGGGGVVPTGSIQLTANGSYDVTDKATAVVDVPDLFNAMLAGETEDMDLYTPAETLRGGAFYGVTAKSVSAPNCAAMGNNCFYNTTLDDDLVLPALQAIDTSNQFGNAVIPGVHLPALTSYAGIFGTTNQIRKIRMPAVQTITVTGSFVGTSPLESADLGSVSSVPTFGTGVTALELLALRQTSAVVQLGSESVLGASTNPIRSGAGYVLVPRTLIRSYQMSTNWSALYAAGTQLLALEDYTTDGTTTGALDEDKIDALLA